MLLGKFPACSFLSSLHSPCFSYIGDCEISVELQKIRAGVNGIQVSVDAMTAALAPAVSSGKWKQLTLEQAVKDSMSPWAGDILGAAVKSHSQEAVLGFANPAGPWGSGVTGVSKVSKGFGCLGKRERALAKTQLDWEVEMLLVRSCVQMWESLLCLSHPSCPQCS